MKFRKLLCYVLIFAIIVSLGVTAFAEDTDEAYENSVTVYASDSNVSDKVSSLLNDPDVDNVIVLYNTQTSPCPLIDSELFEQNCNSVSPLAFGGSMYTEYIKNVRAGGKYYSTKNIGYVEGDSGLTISLNHAVSLSTTVSNSFGFTKGQISLKTGVDVSASYTYQIGATFYIDRTHNGKSVKTGILTATPVYAVTLFDVYRGIQGTSNENKIGTGKIYKPYGIKYHKEYVYY